MTAPSIAAHNPGIMQRIPIAESIAVVLLGLTAGSAIFPVRGESPLNPRVADESGFTVIGIETRTSYTKESSADAVIGKQWGRFMSESALKNIPNKADSNMIAVYSEYDSDYKGAYTFLIGARVNSDSNIPPGMVARKIPAGRYAIFTTEKGPVEQVVPSVWKDIWAIPKSSAGGNRAYKTDYEVYDQRASDPKNAQVEIHIGIK